MTRRLFIASRVSKAEALEELDAAWEKAMSLLPDGAWRFRETQPHITMRFLGDIDTGNAGNRRILGDMRNDLARMARKHRKIPLTLGYLHTFPGVLWASIGGTEDSLESLGQLRFGVKLGVASAEIRGLKVPADRYEPWLPHITLGCFEVGQTASLTRKLRESDHPAQAEFRVESLEILESLSRTDGEPEYEPLAEAPAMTLR